MEFVERLFKKEKVNLDNNIFKQCTFTDCELEYSGGKPPSLVGCTITNSRFSFSGPAADTLAFIKAMYHGGFKTVIESTIESIKKVS